MLSVSSRPQDWGDPAWNYHFVKLQAKWNDTIYINNCHLWTTKTYDLHELIGTFGTAIGMILQPGKPPEICDRSHLQEDDFWDKEWGEMPPYFDLNECDLEEFI